jgi:hypothetical protein
MCVSRKLPRAALVALLLVGCAREPALLREKAKLDLVSKIEHGVLASVEAEKSAVLAVTDEESIEYAAQSRGATAEIGKLLASLSERITADARPAELEKLAAFEATWIELQEIDARLLDLAVANSNLKAARLSAKEGSLALDRFIASIDAAATSTSDVAAARSLSAAATSAARIHSLLLAHIPESSDAEMTALEARMRTLAASIEEALRRVAASGSANVAEAERAWADYQRIEAEVVRLSRLNTNVISFDVSVHEKRTATRACLDALAALRAAIESGPHATR